MGQSAQSGVSPQTPAAPDRPAGQPHFKRTRTHPTKGPPVVRTPDAHTTTGVRQFRPTTTVTSNNKNHANTQHPTEPAHNRSRRSPNRHPNHHRSASRPDRCVGAGRLGTCLRGRSAKGMDGLKAIDSTERQALADLPDMPAQAPQQACRPARAEGVSSACVAGPPRGLGGSVRTSGTEGDRRHRTTSAARTCPTYPFRPTTSMPPCTSPWRGVRSACVAGSIKG